jgi:hypothetical protein
MLLADIHGRLGNTAMFYMIIMAAWGLWRYFRKQGLDSNYWGALVIGEILLLAQGALGAYLWIVGARPDRGIHLLYGIASVLVIPGLYAYTHGDDRRRVMLIYGIVLLFLIGLILRAIGTGAAAG